MALLDMIKTKRSPSIASILKKISEINQTDKQPVKSETKAKQVSQANTDESAVENIKSLFHGEIVE